MLRTPADARGKGAVAMDKRAMEVLTKVGGTVQPLDMSPLFCPRSVSVIGVSRDAGSVGYSIFQNIFLGGFKGTVVPVNPKADEICGIRCYPSVLSVPGPVDLAVIVVKAPLVPAVVEQCGQKGVKAAIVISSGFKEVGEEGRALEQQVREIASRHRLTLLGPNCLGIINTDSDVHLNATFAKEMPLPGSIAFLSQSGALCTAVLEYAKAEKIGFSKLISMGNKAGVNELDLLLYLREDPQTKVILLYLEDLTEGRRFIDVTRGITGEGSRPKPILAVKAGRTPEGAKAISSHTGSMAGSDEVYDAIFAQAGVLRVDSVEELFDYARGFAEQPLPKGRRVAIVTNAGGPGIMATDACVRYGLKVAQFEEATLEMMRCNLPTAAALNNPVDLIGDAQHDRYERALAAVAHDPNVDGVIVLTTPQAMTDLKEIARVVGKVAVKTEKPILACFMGVTDLSSGLRALEQEQVPHYRFPEGAVRAFAAMCRYREWIDRPRTEVRHFSVDRTAEAIIRRAQEQGRHSLSQSESLELLKAYGLPVPSFGTAQTPAEAGRIAEKIGFPVAMKILSPEIVHKFDVGGVRLDLNTPAEVEHGFGQMMINVARARPEAKLDGVVIQQMVPKGTELILGMKRDKRFGPVIMFGLGGVTVEVLKDVAFRLAPVRELGARRMVESIRGFKILQGFRGQPPADIPALTECIERLSQLAMELEGIEELDVNPLMAYPQGRGAKAADARILIRKITPV